MKELYNNFWKHIEEMKMQPIPRWVFVARRLGIWLALAISVVLGAFVLAYFVYAAQQSDMLAVAGVDPFAALTTLLPVWLLVFAIFIGLALWGVEHTERGYKVPFIAWVAINMAVTGLGALALLAFEVPASADVLVERHLEPLSATGLARPLWERPGAGRIQGKILIKDVDAFTLEDPRGDTWKILLREQTRVKIPLEPEQRVGVMGRPAGDYVIEAMEVMPLKRPLPPRPGQDRDARPLPPPPRPTR